MRVSEKPAYTISFSGVSFRGKLTGMSRVVEVAHPLIQHHLAGLRDAATEPAEFRRLVHRLAVLLAYEATKDLRVEPREVRTPLTKAQGHALTQRIGLIPILRAGLGMVDPILNLIPTAEVWHLGLYRDEATARPVEYYSKLPAARPVDVALVLDPMLATGGSATAALATLHEWGVRQAKLLSVIAARDGILRVEREFPQTQIFVCAVDAELNQHKFIVPGLGDAGDRTFNTLPGNE
jgi:uracil phosphoribosyltransferase